MEAAKVGWLAPTVRATSNLILRTHYLRRGANEARRTSLTGLATCYLNRRTSVILEHRGVRFLYRWGLPLGVISVRYFEPHTFRLLNMTHGTVFVDVGSSVGAYPLHFASHFRRVIALEPSREAFSVLNENIALNGIENVRTENRSAWNRSGTVRLYHARHMVNWSSTFESPDFDVVEAVRLDELLSNENKIDIVKVDVEGSELEVVQGGLEVLKRTDRLIIEVRRETDVRISDLLSELGFHRVELEDRTVDKNLLFTRVEEPQTWPTAKD